MTISTPELQLSELIDVFLAQALTTPLGSNGVELCQPFITLLLSRRGHCPFWQWDGLESLASITEQTAIR